MNNTPRRLTDRDLYWLVTTYDAPEFVKAAAMGEIRDEDVPAHLFADAPHREYPTHSAAATWVSYANFLEKKSALGAADAAAIGSRLADAAAYFRIGDAIADLDAQAGRRAAPAELPDSAYAWVVKAADGSTATRRLRLSNAAEIEKAAGWLVEYRSQFEYDDRRAIAGRILEKAAEQGVPLEEAGDAVEKIAGNGVTPIGSVIEAMVARSTLVRAANNDFADMLLKVAAALGDTPNALHRQDRRIKLARMLDEVDRTFGLARHYADGLAFPEDALFGLTRKLASEVEDGHVGLPTGSVYAKEALARVPLEGLRDRLGDDLADAVTADGLTCDAEKMAEILPTLDRPMARRFDAALADLEVRPVAKAGPEHRFRPDPAH